MKMVIYPLVLQLGSSTSNLIWSNNPFYYILKSDSNDDSSKEAIDLLSNSGIKFDKHASRGISPHIFAEYLIASGTVFFLNRSLRVIGLILTDEVKWISFHGGFDFAYLIKMLNGTILPDEDTGFYALMEAYFPKFFDIKCMIRDIDTLKNSGLSKIAADINVITHH